VLKKCDSLTLALWRTNQPNPRLTHATTDRIRLKPRPGFLPLSLLSPLLLLVVTATTLKRRRLRWWWWCICVSNPKFLDRLIPLNSPVSFSSLVQAVAACTRRHRHRRRPEPPDLSFSVPRFSSLSLAFRQSYGRGLAAPRRHCGSLPTDHRPPLLSLSLSDVGVGAGVSITPWLHVREEERGFGPFLFLFFIY